MGKWPLSPHSGLHSQPSGQPWGTGGEPQLSGRQELEGDSLGFVGNFHKTQEKALMVERSGPGKEPPNTAIGSQSQARSLRPAFWIYRQRQAQRG